MRMSCWISVGSIYKFNLKAPILPTQKFFCFSVFSQFPLPAFFKINVAKNTEN